MLLQLLFSTPRISWPMLIYLFRPFDSLPCITIFIIIIITFFFLGICMNVDVYLGVRTCMCVFKLSVFDDDVFFGRFCTCVCSFSSTITTTILLPCFCSRFAAHSNYFILIFQFRNDNNNLPAAKPKIKFTAIQNANNGIFGRTLVALRLFCSNTFATHIHPFAIICTFVPLFICVLQILSLSLTLTLCTRARVYCVFFLRVYCDIQQNLLLNNFSCANTLCKHWHKYMNVRSIGVSLLNLLIYTCIICNRTFIKFRKS